MPCDCKVCFFCVRNLTNGIHHKSVVIESPDGRMKYTKCSGTRVFLCDKSKYCKQCYRKQFKLGTKKDRMKNCNYSQYGCVLCRETICNECWDSGYDKYQFM